MASSSTARQRVGRRVEPPGAVLDGEGKPEQLAEPLVLRHGGQPLVQEELQAVVVGADEETVALCALSGHSFDLYVDIRRATAADPVTHDLLQQLQAASLGASWAADDGFLLQGKRIYVPATDDLRHQVVTLAHSAAPR